jgi:hypothetical protein
MNNNWAEVRMQMDQMLEMERAQARLRRKHTLRSTRWRRVVLGLVLLFALTLIATTAQAATITIDSQAVCESPGALGWF